MDSGEYSAEADLLHPLATLHWEHCHTWGYAYINPTHCAVLHDRVAILTRRDLSDANVLHISSTNLHSWTTTTLPYQHMSLTTYQSMFVAVGGRHPSTKEPTNLLFTSNTGLQWQPSLPPMPTKRYCTSSVSTRSPEVLVVAGGIGSRGLELNVVELLLGDQWSTADPLPAPCYYIHSTLHNGNLCFMGGEGQGDTVYTCSCTSLISSCETNTTTDRPLWRQFKGPRDHTAAASYSSRLVSIDGWYNIRAYSSVSQSWMEATSTRDGSHTHYMAAAVLPTGELVYAHADGVYKIKLSVSSFDPDSWFMSNVLSRLEAVMGIQIVSALANNYSQLMNASGVQLQEEDEYDEYGCEIVLPDPQTDPGRYVEDVFSQWSVGHSHRPPTWRHLLEVLRDISLVELSQQIDTFMKGEMKFVDAYRHFINTKDVLELLFLKFLFVGPPRLGKTTARRRLMGEITDLISASEADQAHPSTGAVESGHNMVVRNVSNITAVVTQAEWSSVESLSDEARILFHNFVDSIEARDIPKPPPELSIPHKSVSRTSQATSTSNVGRGHQPAATPEPSLINWFFSKMKSFKVGRQRKQYRDIPEQYQDIPEVAAIFRESVQPDFWKEANQSFKAFLRMEDTGGQPELMDMLPALTVGPGLYLLFFSYEFELKSEFKVFYQHSSGESTLPEQSTLTLEEMLLSALSSISCSNSSANLMIAEETSSSDMHNILESSRSVAYIVGTHKDKVSEEYIASFDKELQSIIRNTDFFEKDIVQFCSEGKLVVSMDNMGGGAEEVNEIRKLLERAMENHFKKLRIPAVWLLFSLCLRMRDVRTASMECCLELSSLFNMSPYETKVALWFLHHHAGVMMYFPNVPGLEDLVIIDIQVVYDSVTNLILRAMSFDKVGQAIAEKFRRTGQFVLKDLIAATAGSSGDLIPPLKLLALLQFLHIVAAVSTAPTSYSSTDIEDKVEYIMPCVLQNASKDKLDTFCKDTRRPISIAPLMMRYKCGFVPIGVFPAVIASLIANSSFRLIEKGMMKNLVQFRYGSLLTLVTFISWPKFYEIIISELPIIQHEPHIECVDIKKEVESTFEKVSSCMNYGYFMDYQFAFECPTHPGREHMCIVHGKESSPNLMLCLHDMTNAVPVKLISCHKVWFGEPQHSLIPETSDTMDSPSSPNKILELSGQNHVAMFMSAYADLVVAVKPCVHSVADHCLSVGLLSEEAYDTIIQRHDLIDSHKARILLSNIRDAISQKPECLHHLITVLHNVGGCEGLVHRLENISL